MKRLAFFLILALALLMTGCGGGGTPAPAQSQTLAFLRQTAPLAQASNAAQLPTGSVAIYTMDADGANQTQVGSLSNYWSVDISPDGSKLAVSIMTGQTAVYVMNIDGSNPVLVSNPEGWGDVPRFTPDGSRVLYVNQGAYPYQLMSVPPDGSSAPTQIAPSSPVSVRTFTVAPGGKIYFGGQTGSTAFGLFVMDANGGNLKQLSAYYDEYPSVSADGTKIVFDNYDRNGTPEIYIADIASLQNNPDAVTQLTHTAEGDRVGDAMFVGDKIFFGVYHNGTWDLYSMDLQGNNVTPLTNNAVDDWFHHFIS